MKHILEYLYSNSIQMVNLLAYYKYAISYYVDVSLSESMKHIEVNEGMKSIEQVTDTSGIYNLYIDEQILMILT